MVLMAKGAAPYAVKRQCVLQCPGRGIKGRDAVALMASSMTPSFGCIRSARVAAQPAWFSPLCGAVTCQTVSRGVHDVRCGGAGSMRGESAMMSWHGAVDVRHAALRYDLRGTCY